MFKLNLIHAAWLLALSFLLAFTISALATWMDWRINPNDLFHSDTDVHWSIVWETMSSWLWSLWLVLVVVGNLGFVVVRLVKD